MDGTSPVEGRPAIRPPPARWRRTVEAVPRNVAGLRHEVVAFAAGHGANERLRIDVALAVSEALTNAVVHGFADRAPGTLDVTAEAQDGTLEVLVADDGRGLRAAGARGGFGLRILSDVTDGASIGPGDGGLGTLVTMHFALDRGRAGP